MSRNEYTACRNTAMTGLTDIGLFSINYVRLWYGRYTNVRLWLARRFIADFQSFQSPFWQHEYSPKSWTLRGWKRSLCLRLYLSILS